ncbi:hypothetical protein [Paracoccus sp. PAR01]|uniref:hypothetical protein n=1 Tax=Paracoccus sp. PAR01 TaxID=2769282 RepID=UPI0017817713|nr:hypothetical protein [Paracoccus sp. PAR01]MBD9528962.1 hypothetical protein [Paracoccus sp. PAR01]
MNHWAWSCRLNALLLGDPSEPLCSRVYALPDSCFRTAYLRAMDRIFERDHCMAIHARWLIQRIP